MSTDQNVAKLRWLLTVAAKAASLDITTSKINQVCAEEDALMRNNGMILMWQSQVNDDARALVSDTPPAP